MEDVSVHWIKDGIKQARIVLDEVSSCICTIYHNGKARIMMVDSVEVLLEFRNRGYGQKLMKEVIKFADAQQVDSIELVVNQDNFPAIQLYEEIGFERTSKFFYRRILNKWQP